ncbi:MAG TPA: hypothetical protein VFZ97_14730 [Acidimicrobiales bacterium]
MPNARDRSRNPGKKARWAVVGPVAAAAVALLAVGCSSASGSSPGRSAAPSTATSAPAPNAPAPTAGVAVMAGHTSVGTVLTDRRGRTVYLFEKDAGPVSSCYGACASAWPPVTAAAGQLTAGGGANQTLVGTTLRRDGKTQVTYAGHPLYYFVGDSKPGDTTGQGLQNFGGGWDVLTPAGQKLEANG